ncbi:MAG TPA: hypothetical protein PK481_08105 [Bacillota bacterium]|nr:hypothetical protein [Bacillota bacterium]
MNNKNKKGGVTMKRNYVRILVIVCILAAVLLLVYTVGGNLLDMIKNHMGI